MSRIRSASLALVLLALSGATADAKNIALLVGVSEYPNFPPAKHLSAPKNDVRRMQDALLARGFAKDDLTLLADNVEGSKTLPTRAAILDELKRLSERAERGDFVVLYASGHGSRQKSLTGDETDGLDQTFLPRDAAYAKSGETNPFSNVIIDDEFGDTLDAIRRKGANVWFVLDSCFSGTASRSFGEGVHEKKIDPPDMAISVASSLNPDQKMLLKPEGARKLPDGAGKLIAFYASQPNETAREVALPLHLPLDKRAWGSIFTTALTQVMTKNSALTFRQTMTETGRLLRANADFQARQTPDSEGDGLEDALPGSKTATQTDAWRVEDGNLRAGQLEGLEKGAVLALYDALPTDSSKPIAHAIVNDAGPLNAQLAGIKPGCAPAPTCATEANSAGLKKATYARLVAPAQTGTLKISSPKLWPGAVETEQHKRLIAALQASLNGSLAKLVSVDDSTPELVTWIGADGLRFMPNGLAPEKGEAGPLVPLNIADQSADYTNAMIARALLRARQMSTLGRITRAGTSLNQGLSYNVQTLRYPLDDAKRQCRFKDAEGVTLAEGATIEPCDKVVVTVENLGTSAVLPVIFFLDDRWNITAQKPQCPAAISASNRLEPGKQMPLEIPYSPKAIQPGLAPSAINGVFIVGVPFREGVTDMPNLCALQAFNDSAGQGARSLSNDDGLDELLGATRGGPKMSLEGASLSLSFWPVKQPVKN